jgi:hypothetical protein
MRPYRSNGEGAFGFSERQEGDRIGTRSFLAYDCPWEAVHADTPAYPGLPRGELSGHTVSLPGHARTVQRHASWT